MIGATVLTATALLVDLRQKELAHARREIVSLTRILSEQTTRTFEGVALMMRGVRERLTDERGLGLALDSELIHLLLQARSAGLPQVKSIFVADQQGFGVNSSRPDFIERLSMRDREFFGHFSAGGGDEIFISRPEKARVDGRWTYYVSMRLSDAAGKFRGVLAAAISIEYFEALYDSIGLDFVRQIRLLNGDGILLAGHPHDDAMVGGTLADAALLTQLQGIPVGDALETSEGLGEGRRFAAYRRIANYPLVVSAAIDAEDALTPWRDVMRPLVAGLGVVVLFVLATTWILVKNLLRKSALESALKDSDEQLRHNLLETNRQLKVLSASLQNVREEARARIARELHDELGQLLTGIRMEVSWLGGRLLPEQSLLLDKVVSVKGQIDQTIASVRRISSELRPLVLDDLGFAAAAGWYVDQFSARTGLPVELVLPDQDPERGDAIATALFRILQESLTNVARHAGATKVEVRLDLRDRAWALTVRDNGVGFVHDAGKLGDMGLVGMRERAQMLGGKFSIETAPGAGTVIEVLIPAETVQ